MLDADIRDFFGQLDQAWLRKFLGHRIADKRVLRLIDKWLAAGVIENGQWTRSDQGSPQGASVSPLLANVYLHYVLDLWVDWWRHRHGHGDVIIVRWADDFIVGFEDQQDAQRFLVELRERLAKFGLELHPDKTRLIEFGRHAVERRRARGLGKPETFDFLGFTHLCGKTRKGRFWLRRITISKRMRAKAARGQRPAQATPASARPGARAVAGKRGARALRLLRRARQHRRGSGLPHPGDAALVQGASAPQPAHACELGADEPLRDSMATTGPRDASFPGRTL